MSVGERNNGIDTLRGVSIVLVLLHHFGIAYRLDDTVLARALGWPLLHAVVRNGNYAVTMFFAVSGFLITANALARSGRLRDIRPFAFWRRRAARILPCVGLLLLVVDGLAASGIGIFRDHAEFGGPVSAGTAALASLTFWMNVLMARHGWLNYVLCVQWSLSIEEVFYLGFPLFCVLLRRDRLLLLAWGLFVGIGPVWRATHQGAEYVMFNGYLSCFDGIALGCCAALLAPRLRPPPRLVTPLAVLAAAVMAALYLGAPIGRTAIWGMSVMALATAVLLVLLFRRPPAATRLAPARLAVPLRACGRLSYELYLFHLVVLALLRTAWPPAATAATTVPVLLAAYLCLSVLLATLVARTWSGPLDRLLRGSRSGPRRPRPA